MGRHDKGYCSFRMADLTTRNRKIVVVLVVSDDSCVWQLYANDFQRYYGAEETVHRNHLNAYIPNTRCP